MCLARASVIRETVQTKDFSISRTPISHPLIEFACFDVPMQSSGRRRRRMWKAGKKYIYVKKKRIVAAVLLWYIWTGLLSSLTVDKFIFTPKHVTYTYIDEVFARKTILFAISCPRFHIHIYKNIYGATIYAHIFDLLFFHACIGRSISLRILRNSTSICILFW